ncbi:MAG: diacylglycerol kinase family protein [Verrucomicrobiota bacterium]
MPQVIRRKSVIKFIQSFRCALRGIAQFIRSERQAKIHLAAAVTVVATGYWLELSPVEWILIAFCIGFVFTAEAFNTAIESLADAVHPDRHPLVAKAKDVAAGAVLIAAATAVVVGSIVFIPKLLP